MKKLTQVKAIRARCLDCTGQYCKDVRLCSETDCPLYEYRLGKSINRKGVNNANNLRCSSEK